MSNTVKIENNGPLDATFHLSSGTVIVPKHCHKVVTTSLREAGSIVRMALNMQNVKVMLMKQPQSEELETNDVSGNISAVATEKTPPVKKQTGKKEV